MSLMDEDLTLSKFGVSGPHVVTEGMGAQDIRVDAL